MRVQGESRQISALAASPSKATVLLLQVPRNLIASGPVSAAAATGRIRALVRLGLAVRMNDIADQKSVVGVNTWPFVMASPTIVLRGEPWS